MKPTTPVPLAKWVKVHADAQTVPLAKWVKVHAGTQTVPCVALFFWASEAFKIIQQNRCDIMS